MEKVALGVRITLYRAQNCIHRNLQRHRAVSLRQHGFLVNHSQHRWLLIGTEINFVENMLHKYNIIVRIKILILYFTADLTRERYFLAYPSKNKFTFTLLSRSPELLMFVHSPEAATCHYYSSWYHWHAKWSVWEFFGVLLQLVCGNARYNTEIERQKSTIKI